MFVRSRYGDGESCIKWACDALCEGYESPSLIILAGLTQPLDTHEIRDYALKAFNELNINIPEGAAAVSALAHDIIQDFVKHPSSVYETLILLSDLCVEEDYQSDIYDFYSLRWAYSDLQDSEVQWYWDGATKENIDKIVMERCHTWLSEYKKLSEQDVASNL